VQLFRLKERANCINSSLFQPSRHVCNDKGLVWESAGRKELVLKLKSSGASMSIPIQIVLTKDYIPWCLV